MQKNGLLPAASNPLKKSAPQQPDRMKRRFHPHLHSFLKKGVKNQTTEIAVYSSQSLLFGRRKIAGKMNGSGR
jgi:hypothetical protein